MPTRKATSSYYNPEQDEPKKGAKMFDLDLDSKAGCITSAVIGLIVVAVILIALSVFTVPAGNVGIVTHWGAVNRTVQPGFGWKLPIAEGVVRMNIQTQKDEVDASAASRDLQTVTAKIAINFHLDPLYAKDVYQSVGANYKDTILSPMAQNTFKAVTAQYTAEELITRREEVRLKAENLITEQAAPYHLLIDNFNITNFDFSPEFNAAIEAKQVAQQQVETAKQKLAQAQVDAQSVVAAAQGQADAQKALKDTGALSAEYLQYLAITKWDGHLPLVTGGASPFVDISQFTNQNPLSSPGR